MANNDGARIELSALLPSSGVGSLAKIEKEVSEFTARLSKEYKISLGIDTAQFKAIDTQLKSFQNQINNGLNVGNNSGLDKFSQKFVSIEGEAKKLTQEVSEFTNKLGQAVKVVDDIDKETQKVTKTTQTVTDNYKKQAEEQKKIIQQREKQEQDYDNFWQKALKDRSIKEEQTNNKVAEAFSNSERKKRKEIEATAREQAKISNSIQTGNWDKMLNDAYSENKSFDLSKQRSFNLGTNLTSKTSGFSGTDRTSVEKYAKEIYGATAEVTKFNQTMDKNGRVMADATIRVSKNSKEYTENKMKIDSATKSVNQFGDAVNKKTGKDMGMFEQFKVAMERFPVWIASATLVMGAIHQLQQGIDFLNNLEESQTNISMITGKSREEVVGLTKDYSNLASELHTTTSGIMKASEEFLRAGRNQQETMLLLKASTLMSKISGQDQKTTADQLIAITNGYEKAGMKITDVMSVVDKLTTVDNMSATSTKELGTALEKTGTSAQMAGSSFENLVSYIAVVSSTSRKSASSIGESFKTIFSRYQDVKGGKNFDYENENISNVERDFNRYAKLNIRDTVGSFKDFDVIISELSKKWSTLNEVEQSGVAKAIAGTRQRENFLILMNNMNKALDIQKAEADSAGSAMDRYGNAVEGNQAKFDDLKNSVEKLWLSFVDTRALGSFAGAMANVNRVLEKAGGFIPILAGILAGALVVALISVKAGVDGLVISFSALNLVSGGLPILIGLAVAGITGLGFAIANANKETSVYNDTLAVSTKNYKELTSAADATRKQADATAASQTGEAIVAENLTGKLEELAKKENKSTYEKAQMKQIVDQLNSNIPNLNLAINSTTGELNKQTNEIYGTIDAYKDLILVEAAQAKAKAAGARLYDAQINIDKAEQTKANAQYNKDVYNTNGWDSYAVLPAFNSDAQHWKQSKKDFDKANENLGNNQKIKDDAQAEIDAAFNAAQKYTEKYGTTEPKPLVGGGTTYIPPTGSNSGSSSSSPYRSEQDANEALIEKDRYFQLNNEKLALENKISKVKSEQDDLNGKEVENAERLKELYTDEISILKQKQDGLKAINDERRAERDEIVSNLSAYGISTTGEGDSMSLSNYSDVEEGLRNRVNSLRGSKDKVSYTNAKDELDKFTTATKRFFEIQLTDLPKTSEEWFKLAKDINTAGDNIAKTNEAVYDARLSESKRYMDDADDYESWGADNKIAAWQRVKEYTEQFYKDGLISEKKYVDEMAEINKSIYTARKEANDSLKDAVLDKISEQIDLQQTLRDSEEKYWNNRISKMQESNTEQERAIELTQMQERLANAQKELVKRVWHEGQGWIYEADSEAIKTAKSDIDKFKQEQKIIDTEKERDKSLSKRDREIKALEKTQKLWTDMEKKVSNRERDTLLQSFLGENWESDILKATTAIEKWVTELDRLKGNSSILSIKNEYQSLPISNYSGTGSVLSPTLMSSNYNPMNVFKGIGKTPAISSINNNAKSNSTVNDYNGANFNFNIDGEFDFKKFNQQVESIRQTTNKTK